MILKADWFKITILREQGAMHSDSLLPLGFKTLKPSYYSAVTRQYKVYVNETVTTNKFGPVSFLMEFEKNEKKSF